MLLLLQSQIKNYKKKLTGRRWSKEEKISALRIFKRSPTCYRLLRRLFHLPSPSTLKSLLNKVPFSVGVNQPVFDVLKQHINCQKPSDNYYILMWDEMSFIMLHDHPFLDSQRELLDIFYCIDILDEKNLKESIF